MLRLSAVEALAQVLTRLEEGNEFFGHRHGRSRAGIAALPGGARLDGETPKAPQFTSVAPSQALEDLVENHVNDALDIAMIKMVIGRSDFLNELGLNHGPASPPLQKSLCNYSSFRSLPNGDESVKAQSAKRSILADEIAHAFGCRRTEQDAHCAEGQRTEQSPVAVTFRLPVLHL